MTRLDRMGIVRRFCGSASTAVLVVVACLPVSVVCAGGPAFTQLFAPAKTAYLNPAGMVRLEGSNLATQLIYGQTEASFQTDDRTTTAGGDPRDNDPVLVPSLYYVRPIFDENWRLGFTLNVPGGFGASNGLNWAGLIAVVGFLVSFTLTQLAG